MLFVIDDNYIVDGTLGIATEYYDREYSYWRGVVILTEDEYKTISKELTKYVALADDAEEFLDSLKRRYPVWQDSNGSWYAQTKYAKYEDDDDKEFLNNIKRASGAAQPQTTVNSASMPFIIKPPGNTVSISFDRIKEDIKRLTPFMLTVRK